MDPKHTGDLLKHLEKQNELLKGAQKTMLQKLQKLEVEHEMTVGKLYELMTTHLLNKEKIETPHVSEARELVKASSPSTVTTNGEEH